MGPNLNDRRLTGRRSPNASGVAALASAIAMLARPQAWLAAARRLRRVPSPSDVDAGVPVLRRADAHPDAPARRPIRAHEDLGEPLALSPAPAPARIRRGADVAARQVPADLDTPLAALDPAAIPDVPREPARAVPALARTSAALEAAERIEVFELTPIRRAAVEPMREPVPGPAAGRATTLPDRSGTIVSLVERLERGAAQREPRIPPSIEETLGILRGLAAR